MEKIRNRSRIDRLKTEVRVSKGSFISKWIYITVVSLMIISILDLFFGDYFYFNAQGLVAQKQYVVATQYTTSIQQLHVNIGDKVEKDQLVSSGASMEILNNLALLRARLSEVYTRKIELTTRTNILRETISVALKRSEEIAKMVTKNKGAVEKGLITTQRYAQLLEDEYESVSDYARIKSEIEGSNTELLVIEKIIKQANATIDGLTKIYNGGDIYSRASGIVSSINISPGSIVKSGEPLMEILTGENYVIAYATPGTFSTPTVGSEVMVRYGVNTVKGKISEIYPISYKLPDELQKAFRPKDRSQLLRITLDQKNVKKIPPTYTKVTVYSQSNLIKKWLSFF